MFIQQSYAGFKKRSRCGSPKVYDYTEPNGNERFEPVNLGKFNLPLIDGQKVVFTYKEVELYSVCMVGAMIELKTIDKIN
jgi:hypothetical protein